MKNSKLILSVAVAVSAMLGIGAASAADLPVKALPYTAAASVFSWSGFYAGVNAGYGWGNTSPAVDANLSDPATASFLNQAGVLGGPAFSRPFATSFHERGGIVGGQGGYNWQMSSNWLVGLEADIQYAHISGSSTETIFLLPNVFFNNFPFNLNTDSTLNWFGTVRGRLGLLASPNLLIYGTGGLAYGQTKSSGSVLLSPAGLAGTNRVAGGLTFNCSSSGLPTTCYSGSDSQTSLGWAAGVGAEYHIGGNWTAKLEYLHVDLGRQTVRMISPSPPSSPGVFMSYGFDPERLDTVRLGLNYHFSGPVVAKY
jgi:outer membrane immunogenic protein